MVKPDLTEHPLLVPALSFKFLPGFCSWILNHKFEEFNKLTLDTMQEEDVPLLRQFSDLPYDKLIELGKPGAEILLTRLADNKSSGHIETSVKEWLANRIDLIERDSVRAEDISLISFIRRKVFRILLKDFASSPEHFSDIMEEIDRFTAWSDIAAINAYLQINQERLSEINEQLQQRTHDLLEAQQLGKMGSFYWDMTGKGKSQFTPMVYEIFDMEESSNLDEFIKDVYPEDRQKVLDAIEATRHNNGVYECEYRYIKKDLKYIWSRGMVQYQEGKPFSMKGTVMDITASAVLLEKLKRSEELHNQAQALTHIGNWSWNIERNEILWSDEMYRIYGLEPQSEKITFERFMSLVHPDFRENRMKEIEESLSIGIAADYILKIVNPDGTEKMLKGKGEIITDSKGNPVQLNGTCQDISIEHQLNNALKDKEEYLSLLINNAPDAVIVIDEQSIIKLWNPKTEKIFGWKAEEVVGRDLAETIIPIRFRESHKNGMERYLQTREAHLLNRTIEVTGQTKDNNEIFISLTISASEQNGSMSFIAFLRDVTEERATRLELKKKTILLEQKNLQLESINQELESFNYAASHDLQEPLRKIQIFSNRAIEEEQEVSDRMKKYLEKIVSSTARMQDLINDLLRFSKTTTSTQAFETVPLDDLVEKAIQSLSLEIEESKAVVKYKGLPKAKVISFQMTQLFINLLQNAIKYQKAEVRPEITISAITGEENNPDNVVQGYFIIRVTDNGIGFDSSLSNRMFDLFARLHDKTKYSGTGIGLALCKKIVQNHRGFIKAQSDGTTGSAFSVYLPEDMLVND
jgi:PAS domain S-box-containing protein